jgi:uncharacterized radical SAM superfamily Fe-S cluster-containing enzyme
MSVQFSGGEPTLSPTSSTLSPMPARSATTRCRLPPTASSSLSRRNSPRQRQKPVCVTHTCSLTASATLPTAHRKVGNSFDVKLQAIHNLHEAGVDIVPVTLHRQRHQQRAGWPHHRVRSRQPEEDQLPLVPAGLVHRPRRGCRDERRMAQRYTLSHLAHDVKTQTGLGESTRDWFPISFMSTFSDWADLVHGPDHDWGQLSCGCHPNCGIGMALMIDKETKEAVPVTAFLDQRRSSGEGCCKGQRRRPRQVPHHPGRFARAAAQLRSRKGSDALQDFGSAAEVR